MFGFGYQNHFFDYFDAKPHTEQIQLMNTAITRKDELFQAEADAMDIEENIRQAQMNANRESRLMRDQALCMQMEQIHQQIPLRFIPPLVDDYYDKFNAFDEVRSLTGGLHLAIYYQLSLNSPSYSILSFEALNHSG